MKHTTTTRYLLAACLLGVFAMPVNANALENTSSSNEIVQPSDEWQHAQTLHGISISFSKIELKGEYFLSVRFENTTENQVDFIWSLEQNHERLMITSDEMSEAIVSLAAGKTVAFDGSYLIPMGSSADFSQFIVNIQPTQR